jgi:hypothetical protein
MRIFEKWPPSLAVLLMFIFAGAVTVGLQFIVIVFAGAVAMAFGNWLDYYGVERPPRRRRS